MKQVPLTKEELSLLRQSIDNRLNELRIQGCTLHTGLQLTRSVAREAELFPELTKLTNLRRKL